MKPYKHYIHTPTEEKDGDLRRTLIFSITQKLQRMDNDQLKELYRAATKVLERKK